MSIFRFKNLLRNYNLGEVVIYFKEMESESSLLHRVG
jgi:hypothetical protein